MSDLIDRVIQEAASILQVNSSDLSMETGVGDVPDWDSLGHTRLIAGLEEAFDIMFDVEEVLDCETIEDIVELIQEKRVDDLVGS